MQALQEFRFNGTGLNFDDSDQYLKPGDSRLRKNMRGVKSSSDNVGDIESYMGNVIVSYTLPAIFNKVIGACNDIENNAIVYFVWNNAGNHCILRYMKRTGSIQRILWQETILNFDQDKYIYNPIVIGDELFWTDNYNPPRRINYRKAYNYTNSITPTSPTPENPSPYISITEEILSVIKEQPIGTLYAVYGTDYDYKYNNLRGKLYQFRYRWVYSEYQKSTWSRISEVPLPLGYELPTGDYIENISINNIINISYASGSEDVIKIEIAARDGNIGDWYSIAILDKQNLSIPNTSNQTYSWYNNTRPTSLPQSETNKPFDYVPLLAKDQELIDKNRLLYLNILEGYEPVNTDIDIQFIRKTGIVLELPALYIEIANFYRYNLDFPEPYQINAVYKITFTYNGDDYDYSFYENGDITSYATVSGVPSGRGNALQELAEKIQSEVGISVTQWSAAPDLNRIGFSDISNVSNLQGSVIIGVSQKMKSFKKGAWHEIGMVYYDKYGRHGGVQEGKKFYVPFYTEEIDFINAPGIPTPNFQSAVGVRIIINHLPPSWASYYQITYSQNLSISSFVQFYISDLSRTSTGISKVKFSVNTPIDNAVLSNNKMTGVLKNWSFEKGDRVRFISSYDSGLVQLIDPLTYLDYEIESYDDSDKTFKISDFSYEIYGIANGSIVEIYRPKKEIQEKIQYESSDLYPILSLGAVRVHGGNPFPQLLTSPALVDTYKGDTYVRYRSVGLLDEFIEDNNFSDFYESDVHDIGRVNAVIENERQLRLKSHMRFSGRFIENTQVNNLNSFDFDDYEQLPEKYGEIQRGVEVGYTLKILQETKRTAIYIGRGSTAEADGTQNLYVTPGVLGSIVIPEYDFGTRHPLSVIKKDRDLFWFDVGRKKLIKDSANGIDVISDYKADAKISEYANAVLSDFDNYEVFGGYDFSNNEYLLSVKNIPIASMETIVFSSESNRFEEIRELSNPSLFPINPEMYFGDSEVFVSFYGGQMYKHNTGNHAEFYGSQKYIEFDVTVNLDTKEVKLFDSVFIDTNNNKYNELAPSSNWELVQITTKPSSKYPLGMESRLKAAQFKTQEGRITADILNDINTPGIADQYLALWNGRAMRGTTANLRFRCIPNGRVYVSLVGVYLTKSD